MCLSIGCFPVIPKGSIITTVINKFETAVTAPNPVTTGTFGTENTGGPGHCFGAFPVAYSVP